MGVFFVGVFFMGIFFAGGVIFSSSGGDLKIQISCILFSSLLQAFACLVSKAACCFTVNCLTSDLR